MQKQKVKLNNITDSQFDLWNIQTEYYIVTFLNDYTLYREIIKQTPIPNITHPDKMSDNYKIRMTNFLDNCIETIQNVDIRSPEGRNFLYRLNDTWLTALLALFAALFFGAGKWYGNYYDSRDYKVIISGEAIKNTISPTVFIDSLHDKRKQNDTNYHTKISTP